MGGQRVVWITGLENLERLQIVGALGDEVSVLKASAAFEEARPWADKLPPVS